MEVLNGNSLFVDPLFGVSNETIYWRNLTTGLLSRNLSNARIAWFRARDIDRNAIFYAPLTTSIGPFSSGPTAADIFPGTLITNDYFLAPLAALTVQNEPILTIFNPLTISYN